MQSRSPKEAVKYQEATTHERDLPSSESIRIYTADSQYRSLTIELLCPVSEVIRLMAESLRLRTWETFGIFEQSIRNDSLVEKPLKENEALSALTLQRLRRSDRRLVFKCKLFLELALLDADPKALPLYYTQICNYVTTGYYFSTIEQAITLASRQLQVDYGVFDPSQHLSGFLREQLNGYFSPLVLESINNEELERRTLAAFSCLHFVSSN